jgi:hypothetical protein
LTTGRVRCEDAVGCDLFFLSVPALCPVAASSDTKVKTIMFALIVALCAAQAPYTGIGEKPVAPEDVPATTEDVPVVAPPPPIVRKLDCLAGVCIGSTPSCWTVGIITHHPDREALCAARDGAGL